MTILRIALIYGLLLTGNTSVLHASDALALQEIPYPNPSRLEDSIHSFEVESKAARPPEGAIVSVGSSSMRLWTAIHRDLAPLKIIHRGFGGSTMNDLLFFADRIVLPYRPRAVLVYEGENDLEIGIAPKRMVETFHAFAAKVHQALPDTRIYVIAIKPSVNRWRIWNIIKEANELLRAACDADALITFIDIVAPMLDEKHEPKSEIFLEDQVHMNEKGYRIWRETIRPVLMKNEAKFEKPIF